MEDVYVKIDSLKAEQKKSCEIFVIWKLVRR
ncbi:unnamed protein product [Bacillus thuringiensis DB27]|uniref:Uncharacterized protein n=1 Tax=Bacillus thuringiensis DB27 TaxID=1431339 RepID=W8YSN4_BACTU|nr:unnamed protein product [Bacillus thuringiensis DB27]